jgi:hypothetical protein
MTGERRLLFAGLFWVALLLFVVFDQWCSFARHERFDEPMPWALGSGASDAAKGAHCTAAPRKP